MCIHIYIYIYIHIYIFIFLCIYIHIYLCNIYATVYMSVVRSSVVRLFVVDNMEGKAQVLWLSRASDGGSIPTVSE